MRRLLKFLAALMLAACAPAAPEMYPLLLPSLQPVRVVMPKEGVVVQVAMASLSDLGEAGRYVERQNRYGTEWLNDLVKARQQGKPLIELFEADLKRKIVEKGGRIASGPEEKDAPVVTLEKVQFAYLAGALQLSYEPQAMAVVSASTDGWPQDGEARVRTLAVVPDNDFLFSSHDDMARYPDKAYNGIRTTLSKLADRTAEEIVAAQRRGK